MRVAAIQHDIVWEDPAATQARVAPLVAAAVAGGARLVALTEMYATGFSMDAERIAEEPGGPGEAFLVERAEADGVWMAASMPQRVPGVDRPQNVGLLVAPDGTVHRYAKIHPFSYAGEHEHYAPGRDTLTVEVDGVRVSLLVCYDLRFADTFWALAADTDCYLVVANWPDARREHWRTLLAARAIENQAYVVGVNRVGADPLGRGHAGDSRIVDPTGRVLAEASHVESVLVADVDPAVVAATRAEFPVLADRQPPR
ncbi:MAG: nitrilase-related carbon-nitrogen hydrolase [Mycobacteriales bacterium]